MASKRQRQQTLDEILAGCLRDADLSLTSWCDAHGLNPRTVYRLRRDGGDPHLGTLLGLSFATGSTLDELRAAIRMQREKV